MPNNIPHVTLTGANLNEPDEKIRVLVIGARAALNQNAVYPADLQNAIDWLTEAKTLMYPMSGYNVQPECQNCGMVREGMERPYAPHEVDFPCCGTGEPKSLQTIKAKALVGKEGIPETVGDLPQLAVFPLNTDNDDIDEVALANHKKIVEVTITYDDTNNTQH